ncbi:Nonribosomal peptide synthetase 12 [Madurella mycetomatis]|uniref:Nonribosomal peptide synthetase 12 n=1 Tax=Madurella mycetomatis TaxID=100816 RepID=A0A175W9R8_9PEZI|nr:Nonribosomal peptide synthetase 12 [Madurella mycetomatis]
MASWAMLLSRYLDTDQVCFGVVEESLVPTIVPGGDCKMMQRYSACRVLLKKELEASAAVINCRKSVETCRSHHCSSAAELIRQTTSLGQPRFNTAVWLVDCDIADSAYEPDKDIGGHCAGIELVLVLCKSLSPGSGPCYLQYSPSLLSDPAAALVAANYRTIITNLASGLGSTLDQLPVLSREDLAVTWSWNQACPDAVDGLAHDFFKRSVVSHPDAPAICASDSSFTYRELDALSNSLAHFLVQKGIGPEVVVPLCFEKSAWAPVSMLAVIKAGGAFTFLDPSYPMGTLLDIVQQADARFLLCSASTVTMWDGHLPTHEVSARSLADLPRFPEPPQTSVNPSSLLYLIFTSGSTGKPKGVCIEHASYLSSALHFARVTYLRSSSRVLQFASYSFDASILENLTTLLCGGCVCIPDETARSRGIAHITNEFGVTWAFFTPSVVKSIDPAEVPTLETLLLAGEAPSKAEVDAWAGKVQLMNGYGPSECCIASAAHPSLDTSTEAANIGWPVGGVLWVVDTNDHNQLVPVGAVGELAIEGPHLGRGYLHDREKTARAFVEAPKWTADFPASRKRRVYLTGDLVRRNLDGSFLFIGRKDTQVKVKGVRIELGAVEQHLLADHLVRLATAMAPVKGPRKNRLVVAVSITGTGSTQKDGVLNALQGSGAEQEQARQSVRAIRDRLAQKVPGHMVPTSWFVLESFPLMPSGKIDRRKVREWIEGMDSDALGDGECLPDQSSMEEVPGEVSESTSPLVEAFRDTISLVLNRPADSVALRKSFIGLGGDSISALQLVSHCRARNIAITVHDILRSKSIIEIARCAESGFKQASVPQAEESYDVPFDLSPIQRLFFQWEPEGTRSGGDNRFNQSFLVRVKRRVSSASVTRALKIVAERHPMLRCRFVKSATPGGRQEWQQIIPKDTDNSFRFEEHQVSGPGETRDIILKSQSDIDMIHGPVFVVDLVNELHGQLLSMIAHHLVVDLVSWRVIMQDLELLLQGAALPPQSSLPWQAWCGLQADYARRHLPPRTAFPHYRNISLSSLEYWGLENSCNMFRDTATANIQLDVATTSLLMSPERRQALRTEPIDMFLTAVIHSFTRTFRDRGPPTVFRESHGREPWNGSIDISSTVGWFTTMYPVQVGTGSRGLIDTLRRVKDAQRRVPRNGWPYFASRFHHPEGLKEFGSPPVVEIIFDFLGLYQQLEREEGLFEQEPWYNADIGPEFHRPGLFEITAEMIRGKLQLRFEYNKTMKRQAEFMRWVQECERDLMELARVGHEAPYMQALSDFPLLHMGYDGLDSLFTTVLPQLGVSADNVEDAYDTSPMQTGLLLSQAKDPSLYRCSLVLQVETTSPFESVDLQRLGDAWLRLTDRHSSLRTIFVPDVSNGDAFCQVVLRRADVRVAQIRCSSSELDAALKEKALIPLRSALPPHKLTIYKVDDGRTYIRIDINHASIDGTSGEILIRDLVALYDGCIQLPEATVYRDFISHVKSCDLEKGLQYWASCLATVEPCHLPLLDDGTTQDGSLQAVHIDSPVSMDSLSHFCQSHNITLPTVFKLAWSLVLRAYTGSDRVCFGYLVSGRDCLEHGGKENAIGAFANTLTCRADLSNTLASVLSNIQRDSLSDLQHQYCSLAHVQRAIGSRKLADQQSLFNTILNFQIHPPAAAVESSITLKAEYTDEPTEFSCVIDIAVRTKHLQISLAHWTSLVCRGQAENLTSAFAAALVAIVRSPEVMPANRTDLFSESHSNQIWSWNSTVPSRVDMLIHDIVSGHAATQPTAPAIESWDGDFTYGRLEETATDLSHHLLHLGVGAGSIVPLCFEKSAWTIVSMLAVLKAGGAFVLLDPKHISADRTAGIIRDTEATLLVAGEKESILLPDTTAVRTVVIVDASRISRIRSCPDCHQQREGLLESGRSTATSSRNAAYIVFTSGTTGKPKGSVTTHSAICTAAAAHGKRVGLSRETRVLQYSSYTFDACLAEILVILLFGGCVCVPAEQKRTDDIVGAINEAKANLAILTPSVARLLTPTNVPTLQTLVLAGETMSAADLARWRGHLRLINAYGPSECSIACTMNPVVLNDPSNIGRAAGSVCWVVDPEDPERLVPIGAIGELVVEGFVVASGYLNDEARTDEVFIKPPAWLAGKRLDIEQVSDRLYKTGDLVRFNSDGSIKFIGRKDTQSKIHGQRIESGEIEHHLLSRCAEIGAVAVEVIEPDARQHNQTLAAFITFTSPANNASYQASAVEGSDLGVFLDIPDNVAARLRLVQDSLTEVLPSYMVPTVFIPLSAFPTAPSGKLDRKFLREAAAKFPASLLNRYSLSVVLTQQAVYGKTEKLLQSAWAEVLRAPLETIGRETSFFRLGGDSLSAMRLVSIARNNYGLGFTTADIFKHSKLCDMAALIDRNRGEIDDTQSTVTVMPFTLLGGDESVGRLVSMAATQCRVPKDHILDLYPCTPLQEGLMALSMERKGAYLGQNVFLLPESLDVDRLKRAWDVVVAANPILRTRIVNDDTEGCFQAVIDDSITWLHPTCSKEQYLANDLDIPLTWGGPLNRFAVLVTESSQHVHIIWTTHHALFDRWSHGLVLEQLEKAYHGESLPSVVPFNRFIAYITGRDDTACAAFWTSQLDGDAATFPHLPSNTYTPRAKSRDERVVDIASRTGSHITTPTTLRAAWALATGRFADAEDIVFGVSVSGRSAAVHDIDRINGPTMATVPVKIHLDRGLPVSSFLESVQGQATDMIAFEQWGLQNIAKVSKNAAFRNLLIIHPAREQNTDRTPLGLGLVSNAHADYYTYALVVECFFMSNNRVKVAMTYDPDLVPYVAQLSSCFELLIQQLADPTNDGLPLSTLDYCSSEDKSCIFGWNYQSPTVVEACIHDLVAKSARRRPEAAAVCSRDFNMTYSELDLMSTKLAQHLAYLGVQPETPVPAIFEKSGWAIVAQLAVLKAGGVMCMLDPSHPLQRLEDNIETTDANLILASEMYSPLLQQDGRMILSIGALMMQSIAETGCAVSLPLVRPENAAYIVFTSGTTGKPKGSITEHRAFASASASYAATMQISESSRVLQHAAFSFDPYILETFSTLIQGGCVCYVEDEIRTDPAELAGAMNALQVTWAMMTPSFARLLPEDCVSGLKTLVFIGEAVTGADTSWSSKVRLMNSYGPSECSVVSSLNDNVTTGSDNVHIGRGVGSRCWIVEPHNHNLLAPVGCVGELLLESPGLARGYLKEPSKTAEVFIHSPRWLQGIRPNSRLYKTGDLVRYIPSDGTIVFVGRKDTQVKVHGQRLELGEIEHHLFSDEHVKTAAVTLPKAGRFKGKLVVTLSLRPTTASKTSNGNANGNLKLVDSDAKHIVVRQLSDIRMRLESLVPSYMVPSVWVPVYNVPLTSSLKANKREITTWLETMNGETAGQVMELSHPEQPSCHETATTKMEHRLRDIIANVLGLSVDQVSLNRSFIGLGGDSITAIQVMACCRAEKIALNTKDILRSKTIVQLAERATAADPSVKHEQVQGKSVTSSDKFGLAPIQKLYFEAGIGQMCAGPQSAQSSHFNRSIFVRLVRGVTVEKLARAVETLVRGHSMLRARFTQNELDGTWSQYTRPASDKTFVFRHHTLASRDDIDSILAAGQHRLDAVNGPVFSADLLEIAVPVSDGGQGQEQLLFMVAHQLVVDLVSWRVILQDLEQFLATGELLSKDPFSFQAWAEAQQQYAAENLQEPDELVDLFATAPADYGYWGISPDTNTFGDTVTSGFTLDAASTSALLGACNERFRTKPADLFIAALLDSFASIFTDRELPPAYCEEYGRKCAWDSNIDLASTVGCFTIMYPLEVKLVASREGDVVDAVRRTKDARVRISSRAWSYFAARFLTKRGYGAFRHHLPMEILFNYVGSHWKFGGEDALFTPVPLTSPPSSSHQAAPIIADVGAQCRRLAVFDINVEIGNDGKASFTFAFNRRAFHQPKIHLWISKYRHALLEAIDRLTAMPPEPTLSDFPLMPLTYENLDRIKTELIPALHLRNLYDIADMYPCGPTQKGILISQARSTGTYNESFIYSVSLQGSGEVDIEKLVNAWQNVVARHATLRAIIVEDPIDTGEGYFQVVLRSYSPQICQLDCTDDNEDAALEQMRNSAAAAAATSGWGESEPAHGVVFCRTATKVYMQLNISHALIDGASLRILLRDIATAYDGNPLGPADEVDPPTYRDYISHIRGIQSSDAMDYWTQYLDGVLPCHIPVLREGARDAPRNEADAQSIPIDLSVSSKSITDFCLTLGLTPANVFQLAWALVLQLYTGLDQVCFGYLASGRDAPVNGIDSIIGVVCNMLVLKLHLCGHKTGVELLLEVQEDWINSVQHQFVSLADIQHHRQEHDATSPSIGRTKALFNTGLSCAWESGRVEAKTSQSSLFFDFLGGHGVSEYDAVMSIWRVPGSSDFRGSYTYKTSHMTAMQAENVVRTFGRTIGRIMEMSTRRMSEWCLFVESDVGRFPGFSAPYPTMVDAYADELISARAQNCTGRPAICSWDGQLTYGELDDLSDRLANHLAANYCVGPEVLVPVCMEKSLWFVVSVLGILKAGGAFVPMDATQPARFQTVIEQTSAELVVTSTSLGARFSRFDGVSVLAVDEHLMRQLLPNTTESHMHHSHRHRDPGNAAYVMFTSGSTGTPKGVVIDHRAWCSSAPGQIEAHGMDEGTRRLQFASHAFDAAVGDILATLTAGGCLCIPSETERLDNVEAAITRMRVNMLNVSPSLLRVLKPENIPGVQTLIVSGESAPEHELRKWCGRVRLVIAYGPTECSVESSAAACPSVDAVKPSNIGVPKVCRYWVVSAADHNVLVPAGAIGELLIEGVGATYILYIMMRGG